MVQIPAVAPSTDLTPKVRGRKREILAAASRVFRRRGLHATGMREVAAELGMTAGNLYYYFANKQALLAFCQEDTLSALLALVRRVRERGLPPDRALAAVIVGHVEVLNETRPGSLAHLEVEALDEEHRGEIRSRRNAYERALRRLVAESVAAGTFSPVDPRVATLAILGALNWTVKWYEPGRGASAREIGRTFAELLLRGLAVPGGAPLLPDDAELDLILREDDDAD